MALVTVAKKSAIGNGKMVGVEVEGRKLLIANISGKLYAMDAVCSHMHARPTRQGSIGFQRGHLPTTRSAVRREDR